MNFWNLLLQEAVETNRISRFIKGVANSWAAGWQTDAEGNGTLWNCYSCCCGCWERRISDLTSRAFPMLAVSPSLSKLRSSQILLVCG